MQDQSRPATGYPYPYPYPNQPVTSTNGYPPPNTTGAAAPYPYQNHNPYYAPQPNPRAILLRRLFIIFMAFLLILGLILFIFFLIVRPQLPDVYLNSLSVSNFNASNNKVSGNWEFQVQFRNPNSKMSLYYDSVLCGLYYNRESLSETRLQPFDQRKKDQTVVNGTLSVSGTYVDSRLVDSIGKERSDKASVEFDLRMFSSVTFRYGAFRRRRYVTVYCNDVAVGVPVSSGSGKMGGSVKRCKSL
ncbi:NDR1/HIN1-like protein 10 [Cardamine amara subsp. amara]|uniref:NDR1/HIN1-like protein 10 n=1 Tax=Cardamine amara subsp. amara TaxID=228776 RepID=A0ABD1AWY0_CARAN